ncbi:hypothetical protein AB3S75_028800 [Citrus x aurantiifolia]
MHLAVNVLQTSIHLRCLGTSSEGEKNSAQKLTVFPSTKRTSDSWMKNIVMIRVRSIVHPNTVAPPGLDCKYVTAESNK